MSSPGLWREDAGAYAVGRVPAGPNLVVLTGCPAPEIPSCPRHQGRHQGGDGHIWFVEKQELAGMAGVLSELVLSLDYELFTS